MFAVVKKSALAANGGYCPFDKLRAGASGGVGMEAPTTLEEIKIFLGARELQKECHEVGKRNSTQSKENHVPSGR
jgi:hypothetical protein